MKKTVLAALIGAAVSSPWAASAEPSYVKLGVGPSLYSQPGNSHNETAWNIAYGQALDATWGYELGYIHFGDLSVPQLAQPTRSFRSHALYGAGVATMSLNQTSHAYGKVGLALIKSEGNGANTLISVSESRSDTNLFAGLGFDYRFSPQVSGNIEYQYFGKVFNSAVALSAWTAGIRYHF